MNIDDIIQNLAKKLAERRVRLGENPIEAYASIIRVKLAELLNELSKHRREGGISMKCGHPVQCAYSDEGGGCKMCSDQIHLKSLNNLLDKCEATKTLLEEEVKAYRQSIRTPEGEERGRRIQEALLDRQESRIDRARLDKMLSLGIYIDITTEKHLDSVYRPIRTRSEIDAI